MDYQLHSGLFLVQSRSPPNSRLDSSILFPGRAVFLSSLSLKMGGNLLNRLMRV